MPSIVLSILCVLSYLNLISVLNGGHYYYTHFTDGEIVLGPNLHREYVAGPGSPSPTPLNVTALQIIKFFSLTTLQWTLLPSLPLQYRLSVNKTTQEPSPGLSALRLSITSQSVMQIAPIAISQKFKSVITQLKIFQWPPTAGRNNVPNPHKALRPTQSNSP